MESNQRAEALLEPVRWFYSAVTGKPGRRVAHLPAHDVLPYENRSPHAEISEDRAVALWRLATGDADVLIAPVQAALWRMRERGVLSPGLRAVVERDESIAHEDLIGFLAAAGYEKHMTCEMPGQYAVRGGIIDVFSPETPQPVRIELLGDTIESIRAFDPNTQRSTNPVERATLLPLTEFLRHAEVLERQRVGSASGREDDAPPAGFYAGWEFREMPQEERPGVLFDLAADPIVVLDEPSLLDAAVAKYRARLAEAFDEAEDPLAEPPEPLHFQRRRMVARAPAFPAPGHRASGPGARGRRAVRDRNAAHHALSRKRRGVHGRSPQPARRGRACDGLRREHGRTRTFRRHLPRVRTALSAWASSRKT